MLQIKCRCALAASISDQPAALDDRQPNTLTRARKMLVVAVKAILIHGNGGSTAGDIWLPWLERELAALGLDVINQTFPDNRKARTRTRS